MPTFPRVGVELSAYAIVNYPRVSFEHPAISIQFENGWIERRARTEIGRYKELVASCRVNGTDRTVIFDFLKARKMSVEPFTLEHPDYGTLMVNYIGDDLPLEKFIGGLSAAMSWFEFDVRMEGQF